MPQPSAGMHVQPAVSLWIPKNFQWLLAAGLAGGFLIPNLFAPVALGNDLLVAAIIFVGFLTRPEGTQKFWTDMPHILSNVTLTKICLPVIVFFLAAPLPPTVRTGLVLLASLPAAGVSPSLIRLLGGNMELAIKMLLTESVLSCLSVPALFALLFSEHLSLRVIDLVRYFVLVLLIPLAAAAFTRSGLKRAPRLQQMTGDWGSTISVILIVTLVAGIAGKISPIMVAAPLASLAQVGLCFIIAPLYAFISGFAFRRSQPANVAAFSVKNMYINIGLGLGVATAHLDPSVAMTLLAYVIPANLLPKVVAKFAFQLTKRHS